MKKKEDFAWVNVEELKSAIEGFKIPINSFGSQETKSAINTFADMVESYLKGEEPPEE